MKVGKKLFAIVMLGTDCFLVLGVKADGAVVGEEGKWKGRGLHIPLSETVKSEEFVYSFENTSSLKYNKDNYFVQWNSTLQNNFSFSHVLYCPYIYSSLYKIGTTCLCQLSLKQQQYKNCLWRMCWPWTVSEYFTSKTSTGTGETLLNQSRKTIY